MIHQHGVEGAQGAGGIADGEQRQAQAQACRQVLGVLGKDCAQLAQAVVGAARVSEGLGELVAQVDEGRSQRQRSAVFADRFVKRP